MAENKEPIKVPLKITDTTNQSIYQTNQTIWTSDIESILLQFTIEDKEPIDLIGWSYSIYLSQKNGMFIVREFDIESITEINQTVFNYKMYANELKNSGMVTGQIIIKKDGTALTSRQFTFMIQNGLDHNLNAPYQYVESLSILNEQLIILREQTEENENKRTINESERELSETKRSIDYENKVNNAIVEADVVGKVDNKVAELTPTIQQVAAQLAQISTNITSFGADVSLTDNTLAIQSAIDYVNSFGGGDVLVPNGSFKATNIILKDNVNLVGVGAKSTLKLAVAPENWKNVVIAGGIGRTSKNVTIRDLTIDGNHPSGEFIDVIQQSHGISIQQNSEHVRIINVKFNNTSGDGVWLASTDGVVFPEDIAITGCSFENIGRQDIALVHGHDIIISGNRGTGHLDIEPESPAGGVRRVSVVNNIFDSISIMNYSYLRSEFAVSGNVTRSCQVWNIGGLAFTGNAIKERLRLFNVKDATFIGNNIKVLDISPSATSWNEDVIIGQNIIKNIDNGTGDPQLNINNSTIYIWRTRRLQFVNNIVISPDMRGFNIDFPCENILIEGNTIIDTGSATANGLQINTNASIFGITIRKNKINGFYTGVSVAGATKMLDLKLHENELSSRFRNLSVQYVNGLSVKQNDFTGDHKNYFAQNDNFHHKRNRYRNKVAVASLVEMQVCSGIQTEDNDYQTIGSNTILAFNCPSVFVKERLTTNGFNPSGTTTVLPGSRYETGQTTRLGTVYDGTVWVDWTF